VLLGSVDRLRRVGRLGHVVGRQDPAGAQLGLLHGVDLLRIDVRVDVAVAPAAAGVARARALAAAIAGLLGRALVAIVAADTRGFGAIGAGAVVTVADVQ